MQKEFSGKSYRKIIIDGHEYAGRDRHKNRLPDYTIKDFPQDYFNGKSILDLGCAAGAIMFLAAQRGADRVVGVEIDENKIKIGLEVKKDFGFEQVSFITADIYSYFEDNLQHFDCIFILNILHHMHDPVTILNFITEISDDMICMELPDKAWYHPYLRDADKKARFRRALGAKDTIRHMEEFDFSCISIKDSENQESFKGKGGKRRVYLFKRNAVKKITLQEIKASRRQLVIGPGTSGKTTLFKSLGLVKEGESRRNFKFIDKYSKSRTPLQRLKKKFLLGNNRNYQRFSPDKPILYLIPNYHVRTKNKTIRGQELNIESWGRVARRENCDLIVCYAPRQILKHRQLNRLYLRYLVNLDKHTIDELVRLMLDYNYDDNQLELLTQKMLNDLDIDGIDSAAFRDKSIKQVLQEFIYPNIMFSYQKLFALLRKKNIDFKVLETYDVNELTTQPRDN